MDRAIHFLTGYEFMRNKYQFWPNALVIIYVFLAYTIGVLLISSALPWFNVVGVILLSHGLVISAYLQHECFHYSVFRCRRYNTGLSIFLSWINGACYARLDDVRRMHLKHHVSKADTVHFDYREYLDNHANIRRLVIYLEWAYIPAVEFVAHLYVILLPFVASTHREFRMRTLRVFAVRLSCFLLLAWVSWTALLYYAISYCIFLTILRMVDAFQHTFDVIPLARGARDRATNIKDKEYEMENTYSNLVSVRYPLLNLLTLNFVYHTAHHLNPSIPWHQLSSYHASSSCQVKNQVIPMRALLSNYHKHRVRRIMDEESGEVNLAAKQIDGFIGAIGVSFLTDV